jgi:predicted GTPase
VTPFTQLGIPIHPEDELTDLIKKHGVELVVLAYSDLQHVDVMHKASTVLATGADFQLLGHDKLWLKSKVPVISVTATRTGVGKSQTTRFIASLIKNEFNLKVVSCRHPMPYGDLSKQICQRFATYEDLDKHHTTIEEREEYEPHIDNGHVVYAGVDYEKILRGAEEEADLILWDGGSVFFLTCSRSLGNNDIPFFKPDLAVVLADAKRPGHEVAYHPGEVNFRLADVLVINKINDASLEDIVQIKTNAKKLNPNAVIVEASSAIFAKGNLPSPTVAYPAHRR